MRFALALFLTSVLLLAACGDSDSASDSTNESATRRTVAPATQSSDDPAGTGVTQPPPGPDTVPDGAIEVSLLDDPWSLDVADTFAGGTVTFAVTNNGRFPHEFVVVKGASFDALPKAENGAVDEDSLVAGALVGRIDQFNPGSQQVMSFELDAGPYVLMCNISIAANSHAASGQQASVTVT